MNLDVVYKNRFQDDVIINRDKMWKALCSEFFDNYVRVENNILDLAAGYCDFINNVGEDKNTINVHVRGRRVAVDLNPDTKRYAADFVEVYHSRAEQLDFISDNSMDVVFVSNFFEHIPDKDDILKILQECNRILVLGGKLLILQPNIKYVGEEYWDFFDHYTPITDKSMCEALLAVEGFNITEVIDRFLPYTTKSKLPQFPWLVRLYCHVPFAWKIMGKQMFIVAEKI